MNSRIDGLVTLLNRGITQRSVYFAEHPRVKSCAAELAELLDAEIADSPEGRFFIGASGGRLIHEGRMLLGASIIGGRIAAFLERLDSGGLRFQQGVDARQLIELFGISTEQDSYIEGGLPASRELLVAGGIDSIELSPRYEDEGWFGRSAGLAGELDADGQAAMIPIYQSLFETVENAHCKAVGDHALDVDGARGASDSYLSATSDNSMDMMQLVRYPDPNSYTVGHSVRVAILCVLVGRSLGLPRQRLVELGTVGLLHDVGKVKVPDEILYKKGRLDDEEIRLMRVHPEAGVEILLESDKVDPVVLAGAWGHHLRHDLRGYPKVPGWAAQGETTALLQVCDVFEALTAVRPYKPAMTPLRAYEIMFTDRGAFHPGALRALVRAMGLHPPGSHVELSDGSRALVLSAGAKVDRPLLRLVEDASGAPVKTADAETINLSDETHAGLSVTCLIASD